MTFVNVDASLVLDFDQLMKQMSYRNRNELLATMVLTFQGINEKTVDKIPVGYLPPGGQFQPLVIPGMGTCGMLGGGGDSGFAILPCPPPQP